MIKLSRTGITTLKRQYKSVLLKCLLINAGILLAASIVTPANAQDFTSDVNVLGANLYVHSSGDDGLHIDGAGGYFEIQDMSDDATLFRINTDGTVSIGNTTKTNLQTALGISGGGSGITLADVVTDAQASTAGSLGEYLSSTYATTADLSAVQTTADTALTAANNARYVADDASAKADNARGIAETAQSAANNARGIAETAQSAADNARGIAETAQSAADNARGVADTALSAANNARGVADTALSAANNARYIADEATTKANTALDNATQAQTAANNAQSSADAAQGTANTAVAKANDAQDRADHAYALAEKAEGDAAQAQTTANNAQDRADHAYALAEKAEGDAAQAQTTANNAQDRADHAYALAEKAEGDAAQAQAAANHAQSTADAAQAMNQVQNTSLNTLVGLVDGGTFADTGVYTAGEALTAYNSKSTLTGVVNALETNKQEKLVIEADSGLKMASDGKTLSVLAGAGMEVTSAGVGIKNLGVTTDMLGSKVVTTEKIGDYAVDTLQLKNLAVTTDKLAEGAVTSAKILDGTIATADLADGAVTTAKLDAGAVTYAKLNADLIGSKTDIENGEAQKLTTAAAVKAYAAGIDADNVFTGFNTFKNDNGIKITDAAESGNAQLKIDTTSISGETVLNILAPTDGIYTTNAIRSADSLSIINNDGSKQYFLVDASGLSISDGTDEKFSVTSADGNVTAAGTATFGKKLTVQSGGADITGDTSITGALDVTGDTSITGALGVTAGDTKLDVTEDGVDIVGATSITGDTTITGALDVTGDTTIGGTNFQVKAADGSFTAANKQFKVTKDGSIIAANGSFIVEKDGDTNIGGENFQVKASDGSFTAANKQFKVTKDGGIIAANGNFVVEKDGDTKIAGILDVTKAATLNDTLTVAKAATLNDTLTVAKATTLNDTLTVAKAATLNDTLTVKKLTILNSDTGLTFDGDTTKVVKAIDDGSAKQDSSSATKVTDMATVATVLMSAENAEFTGTVTKDSTGATPATLKDGLELIGDVSSFAGTGADDETKNALYNGGTTAPTTLAEAANNISATLGTIHGLAAKLEAAGTYQGNLAEGTTVEQHLTALDSAIGNRARFAEGRYTAGSESVVDAVMSLDENLDALSNKVRDFKKEFKSGMAQMSAMSALVPNARAHGNTQIAVGTGAYEGHTAAAIGGFHWINDNLLINAGVSYGNSNNVAYRAGLTWSW